MPDLGEIVYSRADTVAAVRDFYQFLDKMYLDPAAIREPPEGGWPINGFPAGFDKSDEVLALMRMLPYLDGYTAGGAYTFFANWEQLLSSGEDGWGLTTMSQGSELYDFDVPPDCVGLTTAGRDKTTALLDTKRGIIYWIYSFEGPITNASTEPVLDFPDGIDSDSECEWRSHWKAWAVEDFFEAMKDHFRKLNFIPIDSETIYDVWTRHLEETETLIERARSIYREHGWPDLARYRKTECMAAIRELSHNSG